MTSGFEDSSAGMPYRDPQRDGPFVLRNRWQVVDYLGQGGMGTVYLAKDLNLDDRKCVVKKLRDDFFREEDKEKAQQFFLREAKVLSKLQHPNIVLVLDSFREGDDYYLVMEYVEGHNLHDMLKEREEPFTEEQVLIWARQVCDVLHYLHCNDPPVIYRDLKPSNIMIDTKDRVKLVDFGIARLYQEEGDNTHVVSQGYSPPEQYWGGADPRSDVYALGATMYFLLTGREPLALTVSSPRDSRADVSEAADLIIQRATQQDVFLRYQSAAEMKEELDYVLEGEPQPVQHFKWLEVAVGVIVMFASVIGWFGYSKFVEVQKNAEIALDSNRTERMRLEKQLEEVRMNEARLTKIVEANISKELKGGKREHTSLFSMPEGSNGAPAGTSDTAGGASAFNVFNFPGLGHKDDGGQNGGSNTDANGSGGDGSGSLAPPVAMTYPSYSDSAGGEPKPSRFKDQALVDRDESQLTDPEGLAPLEEDTQR
ncbi:MAG: serine/threonine protein kinase [Cyanobacteria bacterium SZAS TMP-1]|nr:serine/threonine protein kinase [Cyanobacteria bacterium SZAS TMP-1]